MGAYTSAHCYRAGGDPPIIDAPDLARFVERILAMDILNSETMDVQLKFGTAIDQDTENTIPEEELNECIALLGNYDWHVDASRISQNDALALLHQPPTLRVVDRQKKHQLDLFGPKQVTETFGPHLYRAYLYFRSLKEDVSADLCHQLEGNWLYLSDLRSRLKTPTPPVSAALPSA